MEFLTIVSVTEAKADFDALLERVKAGETIAIARDGKELARMAPPTEQEPKPDVAQLIERYRELRKGVTLGGLSIKALIEEGRM